MSDNSRKSRLSRRKVLQFTALGLSSAVALPILQACGTAAPTATPAPAQSSTAPTQAPAAAAPPSGGRLAGKSIKMTMVAGYRADVTKKDLLPALEKQTGLKVTMDEMPYVALHEKMTVSLSGGAAEWDVLYVDEGYVPQLASFMEPLDDRIKADQYDVNDFAPVTLKAGQWAGKQIALPQDSNVQFFAYRKDLFEKLGVKQPPDTWEQVLEIGARAKKEFGGEVAGYTIVANKTDLQISFNTIMFFWSHGTDVFDQSWKPIFNNEKGQQAIEFYRDLIEKAGLEGAKQFTNNDVLNTMQQGKSAMVHFWSGGIHTILKPDASKVLDKIGTAVLPSNQPTKNPMRGTWTIGLQGASKMKDEGWEFVKWFCGKEGGLTFSLSGAGNSTRRSVLTSKEFKDKYFFADDLAKSLDLARARPLIPETQQILDALNLMGSRVITRESDTKAALNEAEKTIQTVVTKAGLLKS